MSAGSIFEKVDPAGSYALAGRAVNALFDQLNTPPVQPQEKKVSVTLSYPDCFVRNTTEQAYPAGTVLGIKGYSVTPEESGATASDPGPWQFFANCYDVEAYNPATHGGRMVVLLEPLPLSDVIAVKACTSGAVKMLVNVTNANHRYASIPSGGDGTKLESAVSGAFRILSQPQNTSGVAITGDQWCTVQFPAPAAYSGYFAVVPWGADAVRVLDGSGEDDDTAGPALINGESFTVAAKTIEYSTSGTTYIWLQATSTDSAINNTTIESGSSLPAYETGKCKILLARVIAGRVVQEHTGPVQGIIWGDCES